jgi:hypothetical protein
MFPYQLLIPITISFGLLFQVSKSEFVLTKNDIEDIIINS